MSVVKETEGSTATVCLPVVKRVRVMVRMMCESGMARVGWGKGDPKGRGEVL